MAENETGPKLSINDLKYIVMEGGGARGATYLGAIRELERQLSQRVNNSGGIKARGKKSGIMDFLNKVEIKPDDEDGNGESIEEAKPIIEGVAGASAGAITAFALVLGLNSDEIEKILDYPFDEFLKNIDAGKYRMINKNDSLSIGQDKKNTETYTNELGGDSKEFNFDFKSKSTFIGDNIIKSKKRNFITDVILKVIADGVTSNIQQITNFISTLFKNDSPEDAPPFWRGLLRWAIRPNNNLLARMGVANFLRMIFFDLTLPKLIHLPIKADTSSVTALIADRGMFSGFSIREFFMDMIIYAATRETYFYKSLIYYFENENIIKREETFGSIGGVISVADIKSLLDYEESFDITDKNRRVNSKIGDDDKLKHVLKLLSNITFNQLYKITKVEFGLSVTNYTTDLPLYFGHEWTPDFRVMEAVGASMSIPPAIKPIYNESDVVNTPSNNIPIDVKTQTGSKQFVKGNGTFNIKDYYFYEHIVKMALAQEMEVEGDFIDVNNTIELNAFLPKLKEIVIGKTNVKTGIFELADTNKKTTLNKIVQGETYTIDYELYKFFYNSQFKGLLLDGGYRNNIPYNFFREKGNKDKLDNILALKLDGSFPPPLMEEIYKHVEKYIRIENLISRLGYDAENKTVKMLINMLDEERIKIRTQVEIIFGNELAADVLQLIDEKDKKERKRINQQIKKNNKIIDRLTDESIANYKRNMQAAPWKHPKSILNIAFEGYAYGSEMGQIKDISDHNYIIPLYSYGIGTYDFKVNEIKPIVALAQAKAAEKIKDYFKKI